MYILGDDYSARALCIEINKKFTIEDIVIFKDDNLYCTKQKRRLSISSDDTFVLATTDINKRLEFIQYFSDTDTDWETAFPNIYFEQTYISPIANISYGNVFYPFSGIFGSIDVGSFNYFMPYASAHYGTRIGNNNILYPYACMNTEVQVINNNTMHTHSSIQTACSMGSYNVIEPGECLYENMQDNQTFYSGIINDNYI